MRVMPLYAMLPASAQLQVFNKVNDGESLVVIATNVAETSLTIPGTKYVVDTGRENVKMYDSTNGMETYNVQWISKASAAQRAGRAGRTGPGHCYCLYSSTMFNNFHKFSNAEISKNPVDGVVLLMKSMGIDKDTVIYESCHAGWMPIAECLSNHTVTKDSYCAHCATLITQPHWNSSRWPGTCFEAFMAIVSFTRMRWVIKKISGNCLNLQEIVENEF
ncbi:hypothetical protein DCAR_0208469 [Daucus carota subsp. sativus]|uniref:RNA helicase n=1 Tax=Daucus carota subsp. sativus TaxID=79200 RepID=A0A166EK14_DAUCS|nr:hypothetical protein DCAR_0208469 [Daucus carota subsp. sativus]